MLRMKRGMTRCAGLPPRTCSGAYRRVQEEPQANVLDEGGTAMLHFARTAGPGTVAGTGLVELLSTPPPLPLFRDPA